MVRELSIEYRAERGLRRYQLMEDLINLNKTLECLSYLGIAPQLHLFDIQENLRRIRDGEAPSPEFLARGPECIKHMYEDAKEMARGT